MSFKVEDGTGLPDSNAYVDVAFANSYFTLRGNQDWEALSEPQKEQAIVLATDYIDMRWGSRFKSQPLHPDTQALLFPRVEWDGIPTQLKRATVEYAVRSAVNGDLWPDPSVDESGMVVSELKEKVGPIEESKKLAVNSTNPEMSVGYIPYPIPDSMMTMFLKHAIQARTIRA